MPQLATDLYVGIFENFEHATPDLVIFRAFEFHLKMRALAVQKFLLGLLRAFELGGQGFHGRLHVGISRHEVCRLVQMCGRRSEVVPVVEDLGERQVKPWIIRHHRNCFLQELAC